MHDCVEVFAGRAAITRGLNELGYKGCAYDVRINQAHNIHSLSGLMILATMLVHCHPFSGICVIEPTCGSWIWCQLGSSMRGVVAGNQSVGK